MTNKNTTSNKQQQQQTTDSLKAYKVKEYTENGQKYRIKVEIRLNDECGNGYEDFALTADGYRIARNGRKVFEFGGCCHDEILKHFPELAIFERLHLCDFKGAPMYPSANLFYHIKHNDLEAVKSYLYPCTADEIADAMTLANKDELFVKMWLVNNRLLQRWQEYANKAIEQLEAMTGKKFKSTATKSHFAGLTSDELALYDSRVANGYYTEQAANGRRVAEIDKLIENSIQNEYVKIKKIETEIAFKRAAYAILKQMAGTSVEDFKRLKEGMICYEHNKELAFNWIESRARVTEDEIAEFARLATADEVLKEYKVTNRNK